MQNLEYLYDETGEKSAMIISLKSLIDLTPEEIEDIEDIVEYELNKHLGSVDYDTEIERILNKSN